jgi:hypothetical protein
MGESDEQRLELISQLAEPADGATASKLMDTKPMSISIRFQGSHRLQSMDELREALRPSPAR